MAEIIRDPFIFMQRKRQIEEEEKNIKRNERKKEGKKRKEEKRKKERKEEKGKKRIKNGRKGREKNGPSKFDGISSWQISMGRTTTCVRGRGRNSAQIRNVGRVSCIRASPGVWPGAAESAPRIRCTRRFGTRSYVTPAADRHASNLN